MSRGGLGGMLCVSRKDGGGLGGTCVSRGRMGGG